MHHHIRKNACPSRPESGATAAIGGFRGKRIALAGLAGALLVGVPTILVGVAAPAGAAGSAPVPTFPDNLNIFPDRDFVSVDGYSEHAGEMATVTVTRPGTGVVGSATGEVSGGDVAFEVNHPGGICWGANGGIDITPDIIPGDVVSISFKGVAVGATTVQDVQATDAVQHDNIVTVSGHIGPDVNRANFEQRIIEPALVDTIVGKRDVRATPGPMTPANKGGYSSSLEFDTEGKDTFLATYIFGNPGPDGVVIPDVETATIAANAGLGERAMAWEFTDPAANRQGMTIAEFGEAGGPGVGGCPNGPLQSGPPGPTDILAERVSKGTGVQVTWTPAVAIPGTPAIDGYRVTAVADAKTNGEQIMIGKTIDNPNVGGTTVTGLSAEESYDVEVVSYSKTGYTFPVEHALAPVDKTAPIVSASPAGGSYAVAQIVTLTSDELASDIYYTTDGSDPIANTQPSADALHYDNPITVTSSQTLRFAAWDPSNNVSSVGEQDYTITNAPIAGAPGYSQHVDRRH